MVYPIVVILVATAHPRRSSCSCIIPKFKKIFKDFGIDAAADDRDPDQRSATTSPTTGGSLLLVPFDVLAARQAHRASSNAAGTSSTGSSCTSPIFGQHHAESHRRPHDANARHPGRLGRADPGSADHLPATRPTTPSSSGRIRRCTTRSAKANRSPQPLKETRVVNDMVVNMVDVGEETGDLDTMLYKIADDYDEEVDVLSKAWSACSNR